MHPPVVATQEPHPRNPDQLQSLRNATSYLLAPDGGKVAFFIILSLSVMAAKPGWSWLGGALLLSSCNAVHHNVYRYQYRPRLIQRPVAYKFIMRLWQDNHIIIAIIIR